LVYDVNDLKKVLGDPNTKTEGYDNNRLWNLKIGEKEFQVDSTDDQKENTFTEIKKEDKLIGWEFTVKETVVCDHCE